MKTTTEALGTEAQGHTEHIFQAGHFQAILSARTCLAQCSPPHEAARWSQMAAEYTALTAELFMLLKF